MKSARLGRAVFWTVIALGLTFHVGEPVFAQTDHSANYVNSLFFSNRLSVMRTSYDRWQSLMNTYHPDKDPWAFNGHFYSGSYDFNWAKDKNGKVVTPMMFGLALGYRVVGPYFLAYTTDFSNFFRKEKNESAGYYKAFTLGANIDLTLATVQADATIATHSPITYYTKTYIPSVRTFVGMGLSRFRAATPLNTEMDKPLPSDGDRMASSDIRSIVRTARYAPDVFQFGTSIFRYVNVGFRYLRWVQARYIPNISAAYYQMRPYDEWAKMNWDGEIFFESRSQKLSRTFAPQDYEVRATVYKYISEPLSEGYVDEGKRRGIVTRAAWFLGVSYKSKEDEFASSIPSESGHVYTGQHGIGTELGFALRVMGFKQFGFQEDSYVKFGFFANYSQYFERYPGLKYGLKFRVLM